MLGVGVCDRAGLFSVALRNVVENSKGSNLKIICIFVFMCVMADAAGGTGFVVMPPLGAIIFLAMGRNPLAGMLCAYGAVSGAFASNLLVTSMDVVNLSFTETAAKLVDPDMALSPAINYYFSAFSVFTLTAMAVFVTVKVVEPRLGQYTGTGAGEEVSAVTGTEKKALKWAVIAVAVYLAGDTRRCGSGKRHTQGSGNRLADCFRCASDERTSLPHRSPVFHSGRCLRESIGGI